MRMAALVLSVSTSVTAMAAGQGAAVRGRVLSADGAMPVSGAEVMVRGDTIRATTDSAGRYAISGVAAGDVQVVVRQLGYLPATARLTLQEGEARTLDVTLTPSVTDLGIITATATPDPRSILDVPAAISVADSIAIRQGRTVGLDETLRMMPGVQTASRFGTDDVNIGIRGSASRARQAIRGVALLLDGVVLSEPDGVARTDLVELLAAQRVEVVRGPVSALYAGSSGGVVNVISQTGLTNPGISAYAEFGDYGFQKYYASAGDGLHGGQGSILASGSYTHVDGYRAHSNGGIGRGQLRGDYQVATRTLVSLDAEVSSMTTVLPGQLTEAQFDADPDAAQPAAVLLNFGRGEQRFRVGARLQQQLNASGSTTASAYFYYGGRTFDWRYMAGILHASFHRPQLGAQVVAARVGGSPLGLTGGVTYDNVFNTDQRWKNDTGRRGDRTDDGSDAAKNLGVYGQAEWAFGSAVTLAVGLRYDAVRFNFTSEYAEVVDTFVAAQERTYGQWSPRTTLTWRTGNSDVIYASVARGFEVPAFGELSTSPGAPLKTLDPKSLWNYEIGARGLVAQRLQFGVAAFITNISGEFVPYTVNGVPLVENASTSRNKGVELSLDATLTRWLTASGTYAYSNFRLLDYEARVTDANGMEQRVDESGNHLPAVPENRVTLGVQVLPVRSLSFGIQLEWQSLMYVESGNAVSGNVYIKRRSPSTVIDTIPFSAVPARALVHLRAQYQIGPVAIFGTLQNLFGITYVGNVVANAANGAFYESGPGRWVSVGARVGLWPRGFKSGVAP